MIDRRLLGLALVLAAGVLYSTAGLFVRALHLDVWTILAWRAVFATLFLVCWIAVERSGAVLEAFRLSRLELLLTIPNALGGFCYILALKLTTVADVMVTYATLPFVTMGVAWLWGRDRPDGRMLRAGLGALAGVAVMVAGSSGGASRFAGIGATLIMNVCFAVILVGSRQGPRSALPVFTLGTAVSGLVAFGLSPDPEVGLASLATLAAFGIVTIGLAMALYIVGARMIPPAEVGLIGIVDVVLGPVLVWWVFGETPGLATAIGGAIVIAALFWHLLPDAKNLWRRGTAASAFRRGTPP